MMSDGTGLGFANRDQMIKSQQQQGMVQFVTIRNDQNIHNMMMLLELKNIISSQLPKMPKQYIVKLVFDRNHECMCILKSDVKKMIGGICFRVYHQKRFAQIAFLAISDKFKIKGYGTRLMNKLKQSMQHQNIEYLMTYADNFAIGYFQKLGFTKEYRMPLERWRGYVKDYQGGTLMECYIHPKMDYSKVSDIIKLQREHVIQRISQLCINQHVFRQNLNDIAEEFKLSSQDCEILRIDPRKVKGVVEGGWTLEDYQQLKKMQQHSFQTQCMIIYQGMMKHKSIWPFKQPVLKEDVPDYYQVITDPVNMKSIQAKIKENLYDKDSFIADIKKMFQNCKTYNQPDTLFYKCAKQMEEYVQPHLNRLREQRMELENDEDKHRAGLKKKIKKLK